MTTIVRMLPVPVLARLVSSESWRTRPPSGAAAPGTGKPGAKSR